MRFTHILILFSLGTNASRSDTGAHAIFQKMPTCGLATPVMIGTPAQSLFMAAAFHADHTRVFLSENCSLFVQSFKSSESSTFRFTSESPLRSPDPVFGGAHMPAVETLTFGGRVFENAAIDIVTQPGREDSLSGGLGGRLGLARGSAIAASSILELKAESVYASGNSASTPGFSITMTDVVPELAPHMSEIVVPLEPGKSEWRFKARSGINGHMIHDSDVDVQLDPSSVGVVLPDADFHRLRAILVAENGASRAFVVAGRLAVACDEGGAFTVPQKYSLTLSSGDVIDINTQVYLQAPRYDDLAGTHICFTIFSQTLPFLPSQTVLIGYNILENRHSVILDAKSETVRFRKSAVLGPRPGLVSEALPVVILHSARFTMTSAGLAFAEAAPDEMCKYILSFTEARYMTGTETKLFAFTYVGGSCNIGTTEKTLPGIYHLGKKGKAIGDPVTKEAIIPLSPSISLDEPSYEVHVLVNSMMIHVLLIPVQATADIEQLDIKEEGPGLKTASESERSSCCLPRAEDGTPLSGEKKADSVVTEQDKPDECLICHVSLAEEDAHISVVSPCNHKYHVECMREWLKRKPLCPGCNKNIRLKEGATLKKSS